MDTKGAFNYRYFLSDAMFEIFLKGFMTLLLSPIPWGISQCGS